MEYLLRILIFPCWIWVWVSPIVGLVYFAITFFRTDPGMAGMVITVINIIVYSYIIGGILYFGSESDDFFKSLNIIHYWIMAGFIIGLLPFIRLIKK